MPAAASAETRRRRPGVSGKAHSGRLMLAMLAAMSAGCPFSHAADARVWHCRNNDVEISCTRRGCTAQPPGGFTPMSAEFDAVSRAMTVCAYSGCWQGPAQVIASGRFLIFSGHGLAWSGSNADNADLAAAIDTHENVAILNGAGFAHPMTCD